MRISSAFYHIQHQIADASQLKVRANRFQLLQLKPGEVYLLFDRFEPDFNLSATLIYFTLPETALFKKSENGA